MSEAFIPHSLNHGLLVDLTEDEFPTQISCWDSRLLRLANSGTHYGLVWRGRVTLDIPDVGCFTLRPGMFFSLPSSGILFGDSQGIVITRLNYQGVFSIGGPIESEGRLLYIDGCRDSLLIPPVMRGEPCFNALYFPRGINQTSHTHPSLRAGMIISGRGECVTADEVTPLEPGMIFVIPQGKLHSFRTKDSPMVICAYHPDSDCGPTHQEHPMLNRTFVNGVSVNRLEEIRTHA